MEGWHCGENRPLSFFCNPHFRRCLYEIITRSSSCETSTNGTWWHRVRILLNAKLNLRIKSQGDSRRTKTKMPLVTWGLWETWCPSCLRMALLAAEMDKVKAEALASMPGQELEFHRYPKSWCSKTTSLATDELGHCHSTERWTCSTIDLGLGLGREKLYLLGELSNSYKTESLPLRLILESASWVVSNWEHPLKRKTYQKWTGTLTARIYSQASAWLLNLKSHWRWVHNMRLQNAQGNEPPKYS